MKITRLLSLALAVCLGATASQAQDIHFSQFYNSPMSLNPALTGVMSCDMRMTANFRSQWASVLGSDAFSTYAAGFEGRLPVGRNDFVGLGGQLWADRAGGSSFSTIQVALSGNYIKRLGGRRSNESYLTAGLQLGVVQRSIETLGLLFGSNWDQGMQQVNPSLPTNEEFFDDRFAYGDINAGLLWFMSLDKNNKSNVYAGMAFSHLNRANMSFNRATFEALYSKFTLHAGGEFSLSRKFSVLPGFVFFQQGPSTQANFGSAVKFDFTKNRGSTQAFEIGAWTRIVADVESQLASDALIFSTVFTFGTNRIGLSYDINISELSPASRGNGAFELSYRYTVCGNSAGRLVCPSFN